MLTQQVPRYSQEDKWGGREERNRWFRVTSAVGKWQLRAGQSGPGPVSGGWADPTGLGPQDGQPTWTLSLQPEYIALESLSQDYGFELLGMCRNQSEVTAVLNDLGEDSETEPEAERLGQAFEEGIPNLARLRLAVNYNQKRVSWALPASPALPCPAPSRWPLSNPKQVISLPSGPSHFFFNI